MNNRLRFSILARDHFTCRYCGRKAPVVVLHVDHVHPRSLGGDDDEENLVTSCEDCNQGKGQSILQPSPHALLSDRDRWRYHEEGQLQREWRRYFPLDTHPVWKGHLVREFLMQIGPDQVRFEVDHAWGIATTRGHSSQVAWSVFQFRCGRAVKERKQREHEAEMAGYYEASGFTDASRLVEVGR